MAWKKGQSGNPNGFMAPQRDARKRAARVIADLTGDGEELIRRMLLLSRGVTSPDELEKLGGDEAFRDGRMANGIGLDRIRLAEAATQNLADRLMGKPSQHVEVERVDETAQDLDAVLARLTPEQLANLDTALAALGAQEETNADAPAPAATH
jgi:hypothetical protein